MNNKTFSYTICSGWWCDGTGRHIGADYNKSSDVTRSPQFFDNWYRAVKTYSNPESIIIIDSASPFLPILIPQDVEWVSLKRNFLHSMIADTNWGGWTRSFLTGLFYSLMNDSDYAVFIEQDCLIKGKGIIEYAIDSMRDKKLLHGSSSQMGVEQSMVIVKKDYILPFINKFLSLPSDREMFGEVKFQVMKDQNWGLLPFGFGRDRPIDWTNDYFYAQHLTNEEIKQFEMING